MIMKKSNHSYYRTGKVDRDKISDRIKGLNYIFIIFMLLMIGIMGELTRNPDQQAYASIMQIARMPIWLAMGSNNNNACGGYYNPKYVKFYRHVDCDITISALQENIENWIKTGSKRIQDDDGLSQAGFSDVIVCATIEQYESQSSAYIGSLGTTGDSLDSLDNENEVTSAFALLPQSANIHQVLIVDYIYNANGRAYQPGRKIVLRYNPNVVALTHEMGHNYGVSHTEDEDYIDYVMYIIDYSNKKFMRAVDRQGWVGY
ncbi:MAG: hypothetical protein C4527_23905 [Candidatus Omnitrophota bacterium]|nr:MAG: hypothetical protein C4527_23905 [Candidatus Omnitrophota bacterium]